LKAKFAKQLLGWTFHTKYQTPLNYLRDEMWRQMGLSS